MRCTAYKTKHRIRTLQFKGETGYTMSMTLFFATGNLHKKREMIELCGECGHDIVIPADKGIIFEPKESGSSFLENSLIKAKTLWETVREPVLADDSGLCVDILDGKPGIYSARWAGEHFPQGRSDGVTIPQDEKNRLLVEAAQKAAEDLAPNRRSRSCRFVCAMVLYKGRENFYCVQETFEGTLIENIEQACGTEGFGYDPIVFIPEFGKTVAQLSKEQKNAFSHRGKAARKILQLL